MNNNTLMNNKKNPAATLSRESREQLLDYIADEAKRCAEAYLDEFPGIPGSVHVSVTFDPGNDTKPS